MVLIVIILYNFRGRKKAEKGLKEYEQSFDLLVQHVKDYAIFMIDPQRDVMTWNEGAEQIKGYRAVQSPCLPLRI